MPRNAHAEITNGNFTQTPSSPEPTFRQTAGEWVGAMKESMRSNLVRTGYQTETYVRSHPGRFIAGACCVGLATGWLISRAVKRS